LKGGSSLAGAALGELRLGRFAPGSPLRAHFVEPDAPIDRFAPAAELAVSSAGNFARGLLGTGEITVTSSGIPSALASSGVILLIGIDDSLLVLACRQVNAARRAAKDAGVES
jgi:hypothetical protein